MHVVDLRATAQNELTRSVLTNCSVAITSGGTCTGRAARNSGPIRPRTKSTEFYLSPPRLVRWADKLLWQVPSNDIFPILVMVSIFTVTNRKNNDLSVPRKPGRHWTLYYIAISWCSDVSLIRLLYLFIYLFPFTSQPKLKLSPQVTIP
jgi:hypothetical protein